MRPWKEKESEVECSLGAEKTLDTRSGKPKEGGEEGEIIIWGSQ